MWGPYNSVNEAVSLCNGGLVASAKVDCSYSGTCNEEIKMDNAISGKVYVLVVTNYAGNAQKATLIKTGGLGTTNCDSVTS